MNKYIIFIHIPKNAGNTVINIIKNNFETLEYLSSNIENISKFEAFILTPFKIKYFRENHQNIWNNSFKFAIKRNIYDKFVSGINYLPIIYLQHGKQNNKIIKNKYLESKFDKDNLLESIFNNLPEKKCYRELERPKYDFYPKKFNYVQRRELSAYHHLLELQTEFIFENNNLVIDEIVDIKYLNEGLKKILKLFNKELKDVVSFNVNNYKEIKLDKKHIEFINSHFFNDFKLLGYEVR